MYIVQWKDLTGENPQYSPYQPLENARLLAVEKSQNGKLAAIFPGSLRMLADGAPNEWYYNGELVTAEMWKAIYAEMKRLYQARREQTTL